MLTWCSIFYCVQYAFLVTSVVQFAGGVVVFFGLLTSPKEVGKDGKEHLRKMSSLCALNTSQYYLKKQLGCQYSSLWFILLLFQQDHPTLCLL